MRAESLTPGSTRFPSTFAFPMRRRGAPAGPADLGFLYQDLTTAVDRWWETLAHEHEGSGADTYLAHQASRYARFLAEELHAQCARTMPEPCAVRLDGVITSLLERLREKMEGRLLVQYQGVNVPLIRAHTPEIEHALLSVLDLAMRQTRTPIRVQLTLSTWSYVRASAEGLGPQRQVALAVTCAGPRWAHPNDEDLSGGRLRPALEVVRATLERQGGALLVDTDFEWGNHLTLTWPV